MYILEQWTSEVQLAFAQAVDLPELEDQKALFLGKSGKLSVLLSELKQASAAEKKQKGAQINQIKRMIEAELSKRRQQIADQLLRTRLERESIDVSLPGRARACASVHPITRVWSRIERIFSSMGFYIADGPEIETDWYNFTALNSPKNHPARSMQDTFYIADLEELSQIPSVSRSKNSELILRTHTSPMQVRYAKAHTPPIKIIAPGRTYRVDSDATHSPMFHQLEGLWIDEEINFSHLKGVYLRFLQLFFEQDDLQLRFRPSYFPFTEPSAEIDLLLRTGKNAGQWLEISGAGQVHPNVIRHMDLDPQRYMGFAFGTGIDRLAMLRYGVDDLRLFYENDLRFLAQFAA